MSDDVVEPEYGGRLDVPKNGTREGHPVAPSREVLVADVATEGIERGEGLGRDELGRVATVETGVSEVLIVLIPLRPDERVCALDPRDGRVRRGAGRGHTTDIGYEVVRPGGHTSADLSTQGVAADGSNEDGVPGFEELFERSAIRDCDRVSPCPSTRH